ncbi:MAG: hypothetical protein ACK4K9_04070 [Bacteroidia bacterium]
MFRKSIILILYIIPFMLFSQSGDTIKVSLNQYAKDERFDKFQLTLALFNTQGDTILSFDYEGLKKAKTIIIKKPQGYQNYSYGYLFFTGSANSINPGYVAVLVGNTFTKNPILFIDTNNDFDFTNDSAYKLPYYDEKPLSIELKNNRFPEGKIKILLSRNKLFGNKYDFKKYMDEYYAEIYKGRRFVGIEFTYREQRLQGRFGIVKLPDDSFKIALFDANSNGIYNDSDTDRIVVINMKDTIFDSTNPLGTFTLAKPPKRMFFEKNGRYFELINADPFGYFLTMRVTSENPDLGNIKKGKKVPKIVFTLAEPNQKLKLKKLRKKQVYIYLANTSSRNFSADTFMLRQIAALDTNNLKVICVLYVSKSYYFKEFAHEAEANYYVVLGTKEIARKLGISSIPQTLWLQKRRRVFKYGVKPNEFIRNYEQQKAFKNP